MNSMCPQWLSCMRNALLLKYLPMSPHTFLCRLLPSLLFFVHVSLVSLMLGFIGNSVKQYVGKSRGESCLWDVPSGRSVPYAWGQCRGPNHVNLGTGLITRGKVLPNVPKAKLGRFTKKLKCFHKAAQA